MKTVKFNSIEQDGEKERRAEIETRHDQAAIESSEQDQTLLQVREILERFGDKKDDKIVKEYRIHPVHIQLLRELQARMDRKALIHLSEGTIATIENLHSRFVKKKV